MITISNNLKIQQLTFEKYIASHPAMQKAAYTLIACNFSYLTSIQMIAMNLQVYDILPYIYAWHNYFDLLLHTHIRPKKSAIGPLVIAPNIAPKVSMEPKSENCMKKLRVKREILGD